MKPSLLITVIPCHNSSRGPREISAQRRNQPSGFRRHPKQSVSREEAPAEESDDHQRHGDSSTSEQDSLSKISLTTHHILRLKSATKHHHFPDSYFSLGSLRFTQFSLVYWFTVESIAMVRCLLHRHRLLLFARNVAKINI